MGYEMEESMKFVIIVGIFLGIVVSSCSTTSSSSSSKVTSVDKSMDSDLVELQLDDILEINLPGNLTTGYSWVISEIDNTILKSEGEPEYHSETDAVGAGGIFTLRFIAISLGEASLGMEYRRPFEKQDLPPVDKFEIRVLIRK